MDASPGGRGPERGGRRGTTSFYDGTAPFPFWGRGEVVGEKRGKEDVRGTQPYRQS